MRNSDINVYYKILGLKQGASLSEVKQAYRNIVKNEHPDLFKNPILKKQAEEKFKKVTEAYEQIRKVYHSNSQTGTFTSSNANYHSTNPTNVRYSEPRNSSNANATNSESQDSTTDSSRTTNSILSNIRPHLRRIIPIVVGLNVVNVFIWVYVGLNNSNNSPPQPDSSSQTNSPQPDSSSQTNSPQPNSSPQTNSPPEIASKSVQPQQCRVIAPTVGETARVFTQPSREADAGKRIPKDSKVTFISGVREFVEVELPDQSRGWVFNDQIYPCNLPSNFPTQVASISVQPQECLAIAPTGAGGARIFSQPSRQTFIGKRIPKNTQVSFIRAQREFIEVRLADGTQGWIFNDRVQPCTVPSSSPPETASTSVQPQQCRVIAPTVGETARVFSQPSREADAGKRIPKDSKVTFISGVGEFVEIELPDKSRGWVFNDQIYPCTVPSNSRQQVTSVSVQPQGCLAIAPTAGSGARIFSQPSRQADLDKRIPKDTEVLFIREQSEFIEIRLADGTQGWIFNDQVQPCTAR